MIDAFQHMEEPPAVSSQSFTSKGFALRRDSTCHPVGSGAWTRHVKSLLLPAMTSPDEIQPVAHLKGRKSRLEEGVRSISPIYSAAP